MITGPLKSQIDAIWDTSWSGGISNPMDVIEQMTYLLFLKRLDELQLTEEKKAHRTGKRTEKPVFKAAEKGVGGQLCRWSRFKNLAPQAMYDIVSRQAFPFIKGLGGDGSAYARHMKDAIFKIPTPAMLAKVVDMLDKVPMEDRDTKGDAYEYMLGKIAQAGTNGQFRTPRHISTMLRIGSMNLMLHGIEHPDISYRDSLGKEHADEEERFTIVLANPPFKGSLDETNTSPKLLQVVKTKKTELLKKGGRAAA